LSHTTAAMSLEFFPLTVQSQVPLEWFVHMPQRLMFPIMPFQWHHFIWVVQTVTLVTTDKQLLERK